MQLEIDENTKITISIVSIILAIIIISVGCTAIVYHTDNIAIQAGLHQKQCKGNSSCIWTK